MATIELGGKITNEKGTDLEGLTVQLYTATAWEAAGSVTATDTTDSNGLWNFDSAAEGTYIVVVNNADSTKKLLFDGRNEVQFTNADIRSTLQVDTINEATSASGVTIDSVVLKDGGISVTGAFGLNDDVDIEFGTGNDAVMRWSDGDADNHSFVIGLGDSNQALHITDKGAVATDWNIAATTHPNVYIHSNTTPATDYLRLGDHDGTTAYIDVVGGTTLELQIAGTGEVSLTGTALAPVTSDGNALGSTTLMWADLFLASGGVINFNNGDVTLTHTANTLTLGGGAFAAGANQVGGSNFAITGGSVTGITDITAADGGTGRSSHTAYAVICGGTTSAAAQQSIAGLGDSGQVLTSNGAGALPTFQAAAAGGMALTGSTNNTIVTVTGADAGQGEANLTFDGSTLAVAGDITVTGTPQVFIGGATSNGNQGIGITIDQDGHDDHILTFKSSDISHGMTSLSTPSVEVDDWAVFSKEAAAGGGLLITTVTDGGSVGFRVETFVNADPGGTKSTATGGTMQMMAHRQDGSNADTSFAADSNLFLIGAVDNGTRTIRYIFDLEGSAHADVEWTTFSDGRLKFNQRSLPYGLDEVMKLNPIMYERDSGYLDNGVPVLEGKRRTQHGFVAQEIRELMPELIREIDPSESWYSFDDGKLAAVLTRGIQELTDKVTQLEHRIE